MHDKSTAGSTSTPDEGLQKTLTLLETLKGSPEGEVYAAHIRSMLLSRNGREQEIGQTQLAIIHRLLQFLDKHFRGDGAMEARFNIMRLHLQPPVSQADLDAVLETLSAIGTDTGVSADSLRDIFRPLMQDAGKRRGHAPAQTSEQDDPQATSLPEDKGSDPALDQGEIKKARDDFARQVDDAISHNQQFGVLLEVELDALQQAGKIEDLEERRQVLVQEVEKFVGRHRALSHKFDTASKYLKIIESDNRHLNDELDRVRMLSLTDELTGLPNRRAFMKRLEDEVGRVNRYGYPISLVLIDLDEFKSINDIHGHAAGDAVLRCYSEYVLSAFRHHDMVARYGGEEFSVVLPNTREEGALRALAKAQDYAAQTYCMHNGERLNMPTFSAGLAEYRQGELPAEFIERADAALYRAKHSGRNRIEIASHDEGGGRPEREGVR